ncbi:hypothetical protein GGE07_000885 [Sinorhizobium terangae]|uniref:hypothetical protein n=1 Tax=Sinorhizobium terangae TaxID=110322 RepID=UPI00142ED500|nr:hypothetical protein [Sinorhizobium terangae]MBB4184259.1 hypothetical protein [Sinorhizobium terangae]
MPAAFTFLDEVFREILAAEKIARNCQEAETIARRLFIGYQSGMRDRNLLIAMAKRMR